MKHKSSQNVGERVRAEVRFLMVVSDEELWLLINFT
jgi:hypothetical protein